MKYKKIKLIGEYKSYEKYFNTKHFIMFSMYISGGFNYRQIGEMYGITKQRIQIICKGIYDKILILKNKGI